MEELNVNTADPVVATGPESNLQRLHDNLSKKDGFNVPFDQFKADMQDENNLKRLHENLSKKDNFNVPYDQFKVDMWGSPDVSGKDQTAGQLSAEPISQTNEGWNPSKGQRPKYIDSDPAWAKAFNNKPEKGSIGGELVDQAQSGSESILAAAYGAPGYAFDFIGAGMRKLGLPVPEWKDSWAHPVKIGGVDINPLSLLEDSKNKLLQAAKENDKEVRKNNPEIDRGFIEPFQKGDYSTGLRNMFSSIAQSAPSSAAMMLSGGLSTATQVGAGAALFGSQNINQADIEGDHGKVSRDALLAISSVTGALESVFETSLGSGAMGKAVINIVKNKGKKEAEKEIKKEFSLSMAKMLIENPWMAPFGEGIEEMGTQLSQNAVNKYTGYKPDTNLMDGVWDSGIIGFGMGAVHGGIIEGVKRSVSKGNNPTGTVTADETPVPTIGPRSQAEMTAREFHKAHANPETGILKTIKEYTPAGTDNNTWYVTKEWEEPGTEGSTRHMYGVNMPDGTFKQFQEGPGIFENNDALTEDQYVNQQLSNFDQQQPKDLSNQGGVSGSYPVDPALKAQIDKETAPAYSHDGVDIPKEEALKIVKLAAKLKDKSELDGLTYSNDPEIDAIIEKAWPKPPVKFKIKGTTVDREDALTRIKYAKSIDKINELNIENVDSDPEIKQAYDAKVKQLSPAKYSLNGNPITQKQALSHIKFSDDIPELQELQHENIDSDPVVKQAYDAMFDELSKQQVPENVNITNSDSENLPENSKDNAIQQLVANQNPKKGSQKLQESDNQTKKSSQNEEPTSQPGQVAGASTGETTQSNTQEAGQVSEAAQSTYGKDNKIVTESRYEELKRMLRDKRNNLNSGFDPELLAIGAQMAAYHVEAGARKFADFSRKMVADMGEGIKPHLKNLYEGVRQLPGMEQHKSFMDDPKSVKEADIDQLLKKEPVLGDLSNGNNQSGQTTSQTGNIPMNQFFGANQASGTIPPKSVNPKVEENLKSAHGIKGEPLMDKFKRWGQEIKQTTHHFKHITEAEFPSVYNKLRLFEAIPDAVKKDAYERISAIVRPIVKDKDLFEAFERHIVLQDLLADVRRGMFKGKALPWGYENVSEIEQDANSMAAYVNNNPLLKDVLNKRQEMMGQVRDQLIENGILSPKSKNDSYFHHQVLDYMNARQRQDVGVSSHDARLHEKGWQRSRTGSMKAYNTNYLESEFEVLAQSLEKLEIKKILNKIGSEINIMPELVEKAKNEGGSWKDYVPEGYVKWFPKSGTNAYKAATIAERAAQNIMSSVDRQVSDNIESLIAEADKTMWVIPEKIAKQLDSMRTAEKEIIPVRILRTLNNWWKQWVLINPFRVLKYNLNNLSGDFDVVMAYNPAIFKPQYAHTAMKELWNDLKGHGMSPDIKEALEQGVITSGLSIQEIPDINKEGVFKSLTGDDNLAMKYWGASKDYTNFRENLLRIAAYKYFKEQIKQGKSVYGVSDKAAIDALPDINEKAGKLARELVGDYGNLSQGGQWLRSHIYPFWSWVEINTPRYYRLLKNTANEGKSTTATGARVAGVAAKKTATNVLTTSAKMLMLGSLVSLWNWTLFPDEDKELSKTGNRQLKLILGRREDGSIMGIRFSGAFADMLSFVGLEDAPQDVKDVRKGDATIGKKLKEAGSAFANKLAQGAMPIEKTVAEVALGKSLYPDIFNPGTIRDRPEHALRAVSMDRIYRYLTHKPLRGISKEAEGLIVYDTDPGEAAYYTVRQKIYYFLKKEGVETPSGEPTQRSNALFYYKQSLKLKNQDLAEHWLNEYVKEGGTKQGYKASIQRGVVTSPLPKRLREKWWATLDNEDKEVLDMANTWYEKTYLETGSPDKSKPLTDVLTNAKKAVEEKRSSINRTKPNYQTLKY